MDQYDGEAEGRLRVMLGPEQIDTCSLQLLQRSAGLADELDVGVTIHAAQDPAEYHHIRETHGITPIELLHQTGLLSERLIIAHGIYLSHHSFTQDDSDRDLQLLAASGATIAHCPWIRAMNGEVFESLPRYEEAGVRVGLGTDCAPQDMIAEMRLALTMARTAERGREAYDASRILDAATVRGAEALRRSDIGRIAPGCAADLVSVRLDELDLLPRYDPLLTLVYSATGSDVDTVLVGGETVVSEGRVLGIDEELLAGQMQEVCDGLWNRVPGRAGGIPLEQLAPLSLPRHGE
ncbi:MAG: amidohydrolase family protein [Bacillota bacterium]